MKICHLKQHLCKECKVWMRDTMRKCCYQVALLVSTPNLYKGESVTFNYNGLHP